MHRVHRGFAQLQGHSFHLAVAMVGVAEGGSGSGVAVAVAVVVAVAVAEEVTAQKNFKI